MEYTPEQQEDINKMIQKEADKRVQQALENRENKYKKELEAKLKEEREKVVTELNDKANLSAKELAEKEYNQKLKDLKDKEYDISKRTNTLTAREKLNCAGIPKENYETLLNVLVSDNDEVTTKNVDNFISVYNNTKANIENKIKSQLSQVPPPNSNGSAGSNKSDFDKMTYSEKLKFKEENPELFKQFIK